MNENKRAILTGKVREHFEVFLSQLKAEINDDVVEVACKQRISSEGVILLLEKVFLYRQT